MSKNEGGGIDEILGGLLGGKVKTITIGRKDADEDDEPKFRPALLADVRGLLEATTQPKFKIGDIVQLRPFAQNLFKWPTADDRCIVTQALETPYRGGEDGTPEPAKCGDITLAFVAPTGVLVEYLHDSRMFVKVGSIYDPIEHNGETLPVQ